MHCSISESYFVRTSLLCPLRDMKFSNDFDTCTQIKRNYVVPVSPLSVSSSTGKTKTTTKMKRRKEREETGWRVSNRFLFPQCWKASSHHFQFREMKEHYYSNFKRCLGTRTPRPSRWISRFHLATPFELPPPLFLSLSSFELFLLFPSGLFKFRTCSYLYLVVTLSRHEQGLGRTFSLFNLTMWRYIQLYHIHFLMAFLYSSFSLLLASLN